MPTDTERHEQNLTRLVRLEMSVETIRADVATMKADTKAALREIQSDMAPLREAFIQAKGFKAGVMMAGLFIMAVLGAGAREIFSWAVSIFTHH